MSGGEDLFRTLGLTNFEDTSKKSKHNADSDDEMGMDDDDDNLPTPPPSSSLNSSQLFDTKNATHDESAEEHNEIEEFLRTRRRQAKLKPHELKHKEGERRLHYMRQFTDYEESRYNAYRSSNFPKREMAKIIANWFGTPSVTSNEEFVLVVLGVTKVFVGEIVELARQIMTERDETGSIQPHHLQEAYRRYRNSNWIQFGGKSLTNDNSIIEGAQHQVVTPGTRTYKFKKL